MLNADQCASPFRRLPSLSMIMHIIKSRKLVGEIYGIMKVCRAVRPSVRKWCNNVQEDVICTCSGNDMCPKIGEGMVMQEGGRLLVWNRTSRSYADDAVFVAAAELLELVLISCGMTRSPIIPSRSTCE